MAATQPIVSGGRIYSVHFPLTPTETASGVFSTYELAEEFCRWRGVPATSIIGIPLDRGFANIHTGEVYNYYPSRG